MIDDARQRNLFPPVLRSPEDSRGGHANVVTALFSTLPYVVWLPELCLEGKRPRCLRPDCKCTPTPDKYISREAHDVGNVTRSCFIEYRCVKSQKSPKIFNRISDEFLKDLPSDVASLFPYVLSTRSGASMALMEIIHDGVMSPNGVTSTLATIHLQYKK